MSNMVCDWRECAGVAVHTVRCDVPRGESFTSLMWHRCDDHTPEGSHLVISPLGGYCAHGFPVHSRCPVGCGVGQRTA